MKFHTLNIILLAATAPAISIPRQGQAVLAAPARGRLETPSATQHTTELRPSPSPQAEEAEGTTTITTTVTETRTIALTTATVLRMETATPSKHSKPADWRWGWLWGDRSEGSDGSIKKGSTPRAREGIACFCSGGSICCYNSSEPQILCDYGTCGVV